jgi:hypothetical protein
LEGIRKSCEFARLIAPHLAAPFRLVDVGCSGGIEPVFRDFGAALQALGFDCDAAEVARLTAQEQSAGVRYVAAMLGLPDDHPLRLRFGAPQDWRRWPTGRPSFMRSRQIRQALSEGRSPPSLGDFYREVQGADAGPPAEDEDYRPVSLAGYQAPAAGEGGPVYLPAALAEHGFSEADFVKIDVDGPDFDLLRTLDLERPGLLGVGIEVNFNGSYGANENSFHNVDRLMRRMGFDLFVLTVRTYSAAALPWPYMDKHPGVALGGRPLQGDAVYLRDLAGSARAASDDQLRKLAALFAIFNLPDEAAEVVLLHGDRLGPDPDRALEALAAQIQENLGFSLSYDAHVAAFEAEAPAFFDVYQRREAWMAGLMLDRDPAA